MRAPLTDGLDVNDLAVGGRGLVEVDGGQEVALPARRTAAAQQQVGQHKCWHEENFERLACPVTAWPCPQVSKQVLLACCSAPGELRDDVDGQGISVCRSIGQMNARGAHRSESSEHLHLTYGTDCLVLLFCEALMPLVWTGQWTDAAAASAGHRRLRLTFPCLPVPAQQQVFCGQILTFQSDRRPPPTHSSCHTPPTHTGRDQSWGCWGRAEPEAGHSGKATARRKEEG